MRTLNLLNLSCNIFFSGVGYYGKSMFHHQWWHQCHVISIECQGLGDIMTLVLFGLLWAGCVVHRLHNFVWRRYSWRIRYSGCRKSTFQRQLPDSDWAVQVQHFQNTSNYFPVHSFYWASGPKLTFKWWSSFRASAGASNQCYCCLTGHLSQ